jgi:hypothetical protein
MDLIRDVLCRGEERYAEWSNRTFGGESGGSNPIFAVNRMMREWGHTFIYDEATLRDALLACNFTQIVSCEPGKSAHDALVGIDRHAEEIGEENNVSESLILEAS